VTDIPRCDAGPCEQAPTHLASRYGVRPDRPPEYRCAGHADWGWDVPMAGAVRQVRENVWGDLDEPRASAGGEE
jgi:hypothetical protein